MASEICDNLNGKLPIKALSSKTEKLICESLTTLMILPTESGLLRDWRGLAELLGVDISLLEKHENPAEKLFNLVQSNQDEYKCTINVFLTYLEALDRFDIIDDYKELIKNDITQYSSIENDIACSRDVIVENESYDAMLLYAENDIDFAFNLVDVMEKNYNLKIFVKDRNLKAGDKEVQATLSVIADHSNKLIVVLSPHFLTSPMNEFFLDYAQTIAIEQQIRKIIPCMLARCQVPKQLLGLHMLTYSTNSRWGNFWNRLADSIDPEVTQRASEKLLANPPSSLFDTEKTKFSENALNNLSLPSLPTSSTSLQSVQSHATSNILSSTSRANEFGCDILCNSSTSSSKDKEKSRKFKVSSFLNKVSKILPKSDKKQGNQNKTKTKKSKKEKVALALE